MAYVIGAIIGFLVAVFFPVIALWIVAAVIGAVVVSALKDF